MVNGNINFAISGQTPFMNSVLNGDEIYALAVLGSADKHTGIIARKDKGISNGKDLKNKNIGVTIGTGGEYFMEIILLLNGILRKDVNTVHLKPDQMCDALIKGDVDAVCTWNPYVLKIKNSLGNNGCLFSAAQLHTSLFLLSSAKDYVHKNPKIAERLIRSLVSASEFIQNHPDESRKIVAKHLKIDESLIYELSGNYNFKIFLDQSFLRILEDQAKWSVRNNINHIGNMPNYLDFIYTDALKAVKPENMTIIK